MSLLISSLPNNNEQIQLFSFAPSIKINLNESMQKREKKGETLTKEVAIKRLKWIKFKSDVLSFVTNPRKIVDIGLLIACPLFFIPVVGPALIAARVSACVLSFLVIGFSVSKWESLAKLSLAYKEQSKLAAQHIKHLESSQGDCLPAKAAT